MIGLAALLSGCAPTVQRQDQPAASSQSANQDLQACLRAVYYSSEYVPLRPRIPLDMNDATVGQISDASLATDDEIGTILLTHPKVQACRNAYLDRIDQTTPTIAAIVADGYARLEQSLIDLIEKNETWGEHLRRTRAISVASQSELAAENRRIAAGSAQSNEAELARRHSAAFQAYEQTQQIINNMK
jgi:hypothetical protein